VSQSNVPILQSYSSIVVCFVVSLLHVGFPIQFLDDEIKDETKNETRNKMKEIKKYICNFSENFRVT